MAFIDGDGCQGIFAERDKCFCRQDCLAGIAEKEEGEYVLPEMWKRTKTRHKIL